MKHYFWFVLFSIVYLFHAYHERFFTLIYYTVWTFLLEIAYFGARIAKQDAVAETLWPCLFAPSIVVCMGFWIIVAPVHLAAQGAGNAFLLVVTHGVNMVATLAERKRVLTKDIWKPLLYTFVYNLFLAIYVGAGGRSISGRLPYWYAQYDVPIGWIFAALAMSAVAIVHFMVSETPPKKASTQYIV